MFFNGEIKDGGRSRDHAGNNFFGNRGLYTGLFLSQFKIHTVQKEEERRRVGECTEGKGTLGRLGGKKSHHFIFSFLVGDISACTPKI